MITGAFVRDRFMDILWTLHFNDNKKAAPRGSNEYNKLYKLNPLVDKLSKIFLHNLALQMRYILLFVDVDYIYIYIYICMYVCVCDNS